MRKVLPSVLQHFEIFDPVFDRRIHWSQAQRELNQLQSLRGVSDILIRVNLSQKNRQQDIGPKHILISTLKLIESGSFTSSSFSVAKEPWMKDPRVFGLKPLFLRSTVYLILSRTWWISFIWAVVNERDRCLYLIWCPGLHFVLPSLSLQWECSLGNWSLLACINCHSEPWEPLVIHGMPTCSEVRSWMGTSVPDSLNEKSWKTTGTRSRVSWTSVTY